MKIKYWPVELQEEIKRLYFYVEAEGTVHRRRERQGVLYDTGPIGTLTTANKFITVLHFANQPYCLMMTRLAMFLATGKQYKTVRAKNGIETDLSLDNLIALGPELEPDESGQAALIRQQMRKTIEERKLWQLEVDIDKKNKEKEAFLELKNKSKANRLARQPSPKLDEPEPTPMDLFNAIGAKWRHDWKEKHEYMEMVREKILPGLAELKKIEFVNGIWTGITIEEATEWAMNVFKLGIIKEKPVDYALAQGPNSAPRFIELANNDEIEKYDFDYFWVGFALSAKIVHDDMGSAIGRLVQYKYKNADWHRTSEVADYAVRKQAIFSPFADYYKEQGVTSHDEMLAKLEMMANKAETDYNNEQTLLKSNKVKEEQEAKDQLAKQAPLTNAEEPLEPGQEQTTQV